MPDATEPRTSAFMRIAASIRKQIETGVLSPLDPIASERELCVEYGVSRMTARRALGLLESEGLIYRDGRRGTFVSEPRVRMRLGSFSEEVSRQGKSPSAELLGAATEVANEAARDGLGLAKSEQVHALKRLRRVNGEALALETTYYRADLMPGFLDRDLSGSLWEEMRDGFGIVPARTSAVLDVIVLDAETSELLGTRPAASGLRLTRSTFDETGRCVEFAIDVYRTERVSLVIDRDLETGG